jgi:glutaredoxin-like protein NrdH
MSKPIVTVYTKPNCRQCDMTKRWLDHRGVEYAVDDITDEKNLAAAKALGYLEAPVVIVSQGVPGDEVHWSGFDPTSLENNILKAGA